jgi:hypothetical protein
MLRFDCLPAGQLGMTDVSVIPGDLDIRTHGKAPSWKARRPLQPIGVVNGLPGASPRAACGRLGSYQAKYNRAFGAFGIPGHSMRVESANRSKSLVSQRHHGVDARGAEGGDEARE